MDLIVRGLIRLGEWHQRLGKGQTMTEYALIIAAAAVAAFATYQTTGNDLVTLVGNVNTDLTTAS